MIAFESKLLSAPGITHGFFTRRGGVSEGVYESLNGGVGSDDDPGRVAENRRRMAAHLQICYENFLVPFQIHSTEALIVQEPFPAEKRPRCDALVTTAQGLGLGVTGADCGIILFADRQARVVGAAHAGWRGALDGIIESTLRQMEKLGARRDAVVAALGPTIGPRSYEVGPEFFAQFIDAGKDYARFFTASKRADHFMFDLPEFIAARMKAAGVETFDDIGVDTYADEERCFSYRRSVHRKEKDYGRLIAAIALI